MVSVWLLPQTGGDKFNDSQTVILKDRESDRVKEVREREREDEKQSKKESSMASEYNTRMHI